MRRARRDQVGVALVLRHGCPKVLVEAVVRRVELAHPEMPLAAHARAVADAAQLGRHRRLVEEQPSLGER